MKEQLNVVNLSLTQRTIIQSKRFISMGFSSRYEYYWLFSSAYIDKGHDKENFLNPRFSLWT